MDGDELGNDVQGTDAGESGESSPGQNPAWNDVLSVLPEQFHSVVTPHFQKWDQSAQQRIEQANQTVSEFEPFKPFVENGIAPQDLEQGLRLMYEINQNPQAVYNALAEAYDFSQASGGNESDDAEIGDDGEETPSYNDPRFDQMQEGLDLVAQVVLQEQQQKMQAQAETDLDSELQQLHDKHGEFDEHYVLSLMANDVSPQDAVAAYQSLTQRINTQNPRPFAPSVMGNSGGGSGLPSQAIDPTSLGGKETRNLVAQMLEAAAKQQ